LTSGDDCRCIGRVAARLVGAVPNAVAEVWVGAEAGDVVGSTAEGLCLTQHVGDAGFATGGEVVERAQVLGEPEGSEESRGDDEDLHLGGVEEVTE